MNSLEATLGALERKASGSLSRQSREVLRLIKAAQDLLPSQEVPEAPRIAIQAIPYREIPEDLLPDDLEIAVEAPRVNPPREPIGETPRPKAFIPEIDLETQACLTDLEDRLGVFLDDPVIQWSDLKVVLREVIRELSGLAIPEAIPPLILEVA